MIINKIRGGRLVKHKADKMPPWMLIPMTEQELLTLYNNLPFVQQEDTFKKFKKDYIRQGGTLLNAQTT